LTTLWRRAGAGFLAEVEPGAVALKSFYSESLKDTLTTASAEGLAWAADPANGYKLLQIEGYCSTAKPAASGGAAAELQLVQYWSASRNDSFLVPVGSVDERNALSTHYVKKWTECFAGNVIITSSSPNSHLVLTSSSPHPHLVLTSSSPHPHPILTSSCQQPPRRPRRTAARALTAAGPASGQPVSI
jgi:hypothetical protein